MAGSQLRGAGRRPQDDPALNAVVTLPEACARWRKHRKTVELAIDKDQLVWRQAGRTYLITVESLVARWGQPIMPVYVQKLPSR
jgi:hypothetical protein